MHDMEYEGEDRGLVWADAKGVTQAEVARVDGAVVSVRSEGEVEAVTLELE